MKQKPTFSYNEKVKITDGFYKGYVGIIKNFKEGKEEFTYDIDLKLDGKSSIKTVEESDVRKAKFFERV